MAELDLIPDDYRKRRALLGRLRRLGAGYLALLLILIGGRAVVGQRLRSEQEGLRRLTAQRSLERVRAHSIRELTERKAQAERRLQALSGLRDGFPAEQVFLIIDGALGSGVWLERWAFGSAARGEAKSAPPSPNAGPPVPSLAIVGQARTHSALSGFVRSLFEQPGVRAVRVQRTEARRYATSEVVDFELAVDLGPPVRS
ncbi:MAG: hypothetical protein HY900_32940 [Deltaproteobacteria bacterium]|nr:hypothetical protein [Deltaproteobacteria bacterium]